MMATKPIYYTQEGYNELVAELDYLKNTRRAEVIHDIEVARGFGDLSENAEYDEARTEQAKVEARITELEDKLQNAVIIDETQIDSTIVSVGSTVTVYDKADDMEVTYVIVGSNEVSPAEFKISDMSPIGHALVGKKAGATVTVEAPTGSFELEILKVVRTKK
ncbi:MAG: transcription elongation factor GreA [Eubacteriales bacterium]